MSFHFLPPSITLIFALSLMLLIFVMFNLFVETEEIDGGCTWKEGTDEWQ